MKLVILDRDGVINYDSDEFIKSVDEWIPLPGSIEAIARLTHAGYRIAVATNQSGLARGYFDVNTLNAMHEKLHRLVAQAGGHIDGIFYCPHGPDDNCNCRKPLPGLFFQIAKRFGITLENVPAIGDSLRDIEAAHLAGASPILVRTGKGKDSESKLESDKKVPVFDDLAAAAQHLIYSGKNKP